MESNTLMANYNRLDVAFERGDGVYLWDTDGRRYIDALSGIAVCSLGHAHPRVAAAVADQAGRLLHTSNLYQVPLQQRLGDRLTALAGMDRVLFCNSGAEANEAAIKIARLHARQKSIAEPLMIVTEGSFHGRTMATLSATGSQKARSGFEPLLPGFKHVPYGDHAAVAEAMAAGTPVVISRGVHIWPTVSGSQAGWICDIDRETLMEVLREALTQPALRSQRGDNARQCAADHYCWPDIARRTIEAYQQSLQLEGLSVQPEIT